MEARHNPFSSEPAPDWTNNLDHQAAYWLSVRYPAGMAAIREALGNAQGRMVELAQDRRRVRHAARALACGFMPWTALGVAVFPYLGLYLEALTCLTLTALLAAAVFDCIGHKMEIETSMNRLANAIHEGKRAARMCYLEAEKQMQEAQGRCFNPFCALDDAPHWISDAPY